MTAHDPPLLRIEQARLPQHLERDRDLPQIVEHPGHPELPQELVWEAEREADAHGDHRDVDGMIQRVLVVGLDAGQSKHESRSLQHLFQHGGGVHAERADVLEAEGPAVPDRRFDVAQNLDRPVVGSPGDALAALPVGLARRGQVEVGEPTAGGPLADRRADPLGQRLEEGVDLAVLETLCERDGAEAALVLAGFQEAPVQEALARQDAVVGHEEIAHEAIGQPPLPGQVRGQRIEERLLGPARLGMGRQVEAGGPQHAVQIGEDELGIRSRGVTHRAASSSSVRAASAAAAISRSRRSVRFQGQTWRRARLAKRLAGAGAPDRRQSVDGLLAQGHVGHARGPGRDVPQDRHGLVAPERSEGADGFQPHLRLDVPRQREDRRRGAGRSDQGERPHRLDPHPDVGMAEERRHRTECGLVSDLAQDVDKIAHQEPPRVLEPPHERRHDGRAHLGEHLAHPGPNLAVALIGQERR